MPVPCPTLYSPLLRGRNRRALLPMSCGGVMGCLYEIYRDVPAPSTEHGVGWDIWRAIFSAGQEEAIVGAVKRYHAAEISHSTRQQLNFQQNSLNGGTLISSRCVVGHLCCLINGCNFPPRCGASSKAAVVKVIFSTARLS